MIFKLEIEVFLKNSLILKFLSKKYFFSNKKFLSFLNCLIGIASKNSLPKKITGPFLISSKLFIHLAPLLIFFFLNFYQIFAFFVQKEFFD